MEPTTQAISPLELGAAAILIIWVLKTSYEFASNVLNIMKQPAEKLKEKTESQDGFTTGDRLKLETASIQIENIHKELAVTRGLERALIELASANKRQLTILEELTQLQKQVINVLAKLTADN